MQIIAKSTLRDFWNRHPQAERPLADWYALVSKEDWKGPADIKRRFGANVDFIGDNRAIFDIAGDSYRLIVRISYERKRLMIKFVGTHAEYDKINAEVVGR